MKFKNKQEAFNYYNTKTIEEIERRAQEIKNEIASNPNADVEALNVEAEGLQEAKENKKEKQEEQRGFNPITGANFENKQTVELRNGDVYKSAEYRSAFYKSLMGKELNTNERMAMNKAIEIEKRDSAYATSSDVAVVIPTTTLNEVVKKARTMGGILSVARAFNMPTKIAIPVATPSAKANWHTEGASVDTEKPTLANVTFDGNEILKVFSISTKVKTMSIDAFENYLVEELTNCVMDCIADSLVNGTGATGTGAGLKSITFGATNSVTVAKTATLTYADIIKAISLLKRGYSAGAKFAMSNATLYGSVYSLTDDNKRPLFIPDPTEAGKGKLLGFEVVVDDNIALNDIYFGNFNYLGYNLANGIAVESSTQSSFKSGLIDYRGMAIADTKVIVDEAFVKITKATA